MSPNFAACAIVCPSTPGVDASVCTANGSFFKPGFVFTIASDLSAYDWPADKGLISPGIYRPIVEARDARLDKVSEPPKRAAFIIDAEIAAGGGPNASGPAPGP